MGLQLMCFTFDPKCTGTFWTVPPFDTKCTGTFLAVPTDFAGICGCRCSSLEKCTGTFLAVLTFESSPTVSYYKLAYELTYYELSYYKLAYELAYNKLSYYKLAYKLAYNLSYKLAYELAYNIAYYALLLRAHLRALLL